MHLPYLPRLTLWLSLALGLAACGPSAGGSGDDDGADGGVVDRADTDHDGISDSDEGAATAVDTDGDGQPDFQDADSDGDGIGDAEEAGDGDLASRPVDSDDDDLADFRDLDSDDNGITDADDGTDDQLDQDGDGNWRDLDDDGDLINDVVEDAADGVDSDGDNIPDYHDLDSDKDTIADFHERALDRDGDMVPNFRDDDSDGDCIKDIDEAGDAALTTEPADTDGDGTFDFLDVDSDADGLADASEDVNCNGMLDGNETSVTTGDSDGDGVTDLVEVAAGTDPRDAADNPQANGDFVFLEPYQAPPSPSDDDLDFSTTLKKVDVYALLDLSGSMATELDSVHANMATVLDHLTCAPSGSGAAGDCIPDLWSGFGTFTYEERNPYLNRLRLQPNPAAIGNATITVDTAACPNGCDETALLSTWSAMTGKSSTQSGCSPSASFAASSGCAASPAGASGVGYPCFRDGALPVVLVATDEAPSATFACPSFTNVIAASNSIGAKVIGILGSGGSAQVTTDLAALASGTGAVDAGGSPLVFDGAGTNAATAIEDAIRTVANNVPLDVASAATDDPSDGEDAVAAFVDHLETLELGTAQCSSGLTTADSNADSFDDEFVALLPGTPVCWKLVAKPNTTVAPTAEPQLFRATVDVTGGGVTQLDSRDVYFLVPPVIEEPGVD